MIINLQMNEQEATTIIGMLGNQPNTTNTFMLYQQLKLQMEQQINQVINAQKDEMK